MTNELRKGIIAALTNQPSTNFSAQEVNEAAINALAKEIGLSENSTYKEIERAEASAFAIVEELVDEVLPAKIQGIMGQFAEVKTFARDAEVIFDIEKIGKKRAKLTISKGARGGIYRAAKLDNKYFSLPVDVYTVGIYVTLEELLLGTITLGELFNNIVEGFQEVVYKEVYNALISATPAAGAPYEKIVGTATSGSGNHNYDSNRNILTTKETMGAAIDIVMQYVKQYGVPTIFGFYKELQNLYNPIANTTYAAGYPNNQDSMDIRNVGFVQVYKGVNVVELPNYLEDKTNDKWAYASNYVFVIPSGAKPVKVAMKGDLYIKRNEQATGSEKWEAHKMLGVGVAMANNYAVIKITN